MGQLWMQISGENGSVFNANQQSGEKFDFLAKFAAANGFTRFGDAWNEDLKGVFRKLSLNAETIGSMLTALPENRDSWKIIEQFGTEVNEAYWKSKAARFVSGPAADLIYAVENYLLRGRALDAIQASVRQLKELPSPLLLQLLDVAVPQINRDGANTMTVYYIEQVFKELETRTDIEPKVIAAKEFAYLPFFSHTEKNLTLHRLMTEDAETYMSVICAVFLPRGAPENKEITTQEKQLASASYELLQGLHILPGQIGDDISLEKLKAWCVDVRNLAKASDREEITDLYIGYMLAHAPSSPTDSVWPHEAVRSLIEEIGSNEIERGISIEKFNMRGVVSRAIGEGGVKERELAQKAQTASEQLSSWPRTAALLTHISKMWLEHAQQVDIRAEKDSLRW